jgi:transposase
MSEASAMLGVSSNTVATWLRPRNRARVVKEDPS